MKLADKPGSVVDSHSSRRFVTLRSSNLPADDASNAKVSLFDLAPNGVYRAVRVTTSAVGSYPAVSPSPLPCGTWAVYFLWHCSSPHGVRPLTGILLCGARTFLPLLLGGDCLASFTCILARGRKCPPNAHQSRANPFHAQAMNNYNRAHYAT